MDLNRKRAFFGGNARDCAAHLPGVLANFDLMAGVFADSAFVFAENDSVDDTKNLLQRWCHGRPNARVISRDGMASACPVRTLRLASGRNLYSSIARSEYGDFDYFISLDCDDVSAVPIDVEAFKSAIAFLDQNSSCAAVCPNSGGRYYDMWAFIHPTLCPIDCWEEVCDYACSRRVSDEEAFNQTLAKRTFTLAPTDPPLEVDSAFGGMAIYKMASVKRNSTPYIGHRRKIIPPWSPGLTGAQPREMGWQCCDHNSFNRGLRDAGELIVVLPHFVTAPGGGVMNPSAWRYMLFDPWLPPGREFDFNDSTTWTKVERNQPCPCGSGKRFKQCHGSFTRGP